PTSNKPGGWLPSDPLFGIKGWMSRYSPAHSLTARAAAKAEAARGNAAAPVDAPKQRAHRRLTLIHVVTVPLSLRFLRGQTQFMHERRYQVHVVSSGGPLLDEFVAGQPAVAHILGLTRSVTPLRDAKELLKLCWLLLRLRPDIVHAHTPKGGLLGIVSAWLAGVPVRIYQARGLRLATTQGAMRLLLTLTERVTCGLATDVVCNSHSLRAEFLRLGLSSPKKTRVLLNGSGNGVELDGRFNRDALPAGVRQAVRERHGIPSDALVIGFVGRLARDKGIVELYEAWRELRGAFPTARWMLVGPYDDTDPIPSEIRRGLEADARIHLVPFTEHVAEYYAAM